MGDALAEFPPLAPLGVHVMGIEIAALASAQNDVGLGNGPARGFAEGSHLAILEGLGAHSSVLSWKFAK